MVPARLVGLVSLLLQHSVGPDDSADAQQHAARQHIAHRKTLKTEKAGKQGQIERRELALQLAMEYYVCQHSDSSGNLSSKEKRPPLKRQIVRTISNLVVPRSAGGGGGAGSRDQAGRGGGFSREPSYN
ncbi:hypothetical protein C2845_PM01G26430 [Panicum miliaceum]|uniref:Uncharacterized protein n=1 Tax=Panicum miliaceum TaxID=4540 RepID=A0A3L6TQT4_PANMI|nr:hypothetical protein C2845_PM01G26430 [Panicum miliaceum]